MCSIHPHSTDHRPTSTLTFALASTVKDMELHLVDNSGQSLDVSLALDALTMGVLAGVLCALIGQLITPPTALTTAPALAAAGVWALHHRAQHPPHPPADTPSPGEKPDANNHPHHPHLTTHSAGADQEKSRKTPQALYHTTSPHLGPGQCTRSENLMPHNN